MTGLSKWLRVVADAGGKGVVNNIDARALGRAADEIDMLIESRAGLLAAAKEALDVWNDKSGMGTVYSMTRASSSLRAAIAKAEEA